VRVAGAGSAVWSASQQHNPITDCTLSSSTVGPLPLDSSTPLVAVLPGDTASTAAAARAPPGLRLDALCTAAVAAGGDVASLYQTTGALLVNKPQLADKVITAIDVKNVQIKTKNVKNVKNVTKIKKTFVNVTKNVTSS